MTAPIPLDTQDIHALAHVLECQIEARWQDVLEQNAVQLAAAYARAGDAAYGTYQHLLLRDLKRQMREAGLIATPPLPGDFMTSREWGNADETDQERWMWSAIHAASGEALGTLVHVIPHDHTRFHLPRRPQMFGLTATERADVEAALSARSSDFAAALPFHVWYERYLSDQAGE